jgi:hypothetical protein
MVTELNGGGHHSFKMYCSVIQDYTPNFAEPRNNWITGRSRAARNKIRKTNKELFNAYLKDVKDSLSAGIKYLQSLCAIKSSVIRPDWARLGYIDMSDDPLRDTSKDTLFMVDGLAYSDT